MDILQVQAQVTKIATMGHRSLRISFDTEENLSDPMFSKILPWADKTGWLVFSVEPVQPETLTSLPPLTYDKDEKTPGQRLRGSLFILYEQKGKPTATFNEFYTNQMERLIKFVQDQLT